jgi:hypothetical protein
MDEQLADLKARTVRLQAVVEELQETKPGLPTITYIIMANDISGAEHADGLLRGGAIGWKDAIWFCGSYSRCDYALRWADEGIIPRYALLERWPHLWSASDPDDTDPRFLEVWREAWKRNAEQTLKDDPERSLPTGAAPLRVYRGQMPDDPFGIAWSLSSETAARFASGVGVRAKVDGVIYEGRIPKRLVMGYLTGRGEREVVLCPADLLTEPKQRGGRP